LKKAKIKTVWKKLKLFDSKAKINLSLRQILFHT